MEISDDGRGLNKDKILNKAVEKAQTKVEARNFEIRKQLLKYDDVMISIDTQYTEDQKDTPMKELGGMTPMDLMRQRAFLKNNNSFPSG